jgi:hypothetical protein
LQDEAQLEEEERVRKEEQRREEEERMRAAQREQEQREKEELERVMRDEAERLEREKRDRMAGRSTSGVRGVRGTRASMRAMGAAGRGVSRAGALDLYSAPRSCMLTSENHAPCSVRVVYGYEWPYEGTERDGLRPLEDRKTVIVCILLGTRHKHSPGHLKAILTEDGTPIS